MKRYFKIYQNSGKQQQTIKILETRQKYKEIRAKFGQCEELTSGEVRTMRKIGVPLVKG